jgi:ABC-type antimicrobial peptide transport system permease subunit
MFGQFGVVAVALTAVGIYGTLAFSTRRQTSEIGVRMTLGASPGDVLRMVGRRGLTVVAQGWVFGAGATYVMTGVIESQLYEVARTDVRAFAAASAAVILAGLAGSVVPALRAARIDPAVALRNE